MLKQTNNTILKYCGYIIILIIIFTFTYGKITVIDGRTAFTGGINLADEYINEEERFGHWKDTGILIRGRAVNSFLMMFLQMWNITEKKPDHFENYWKERGGALPGESGNFHTGGYMMPYGDSPLDDETIGKYVYMDILNKAEDYVYIMTPYLILDSDMITALTFAAKRGVEVIIIMPHIPDKKYAYVLARSYYAELIQAGVRIYEYTPGFVHAKVFLSDDLRAVVGSVNMDFRSMYLHFECGVYLYQNEVLYDIYRDFEDTRKNCQLITLEECRKYPVALQLAGSVLRLFAPLM